MKCVVWLLCVFVIPFYPCSQVLRKPAAAIYGIGAYSIRQADVFSFCSNQAALVQIKHTTAGIYGERRFLLEALNDYHGAIAVVSPAGNFGVKMRCYGAAAYRETQFGLAHARKLGNKLDIGIQFNYNNKTISGYGAESEITVECGAVFHLSEQLHTGIHISNPAGNMLPLVVAMGIGYEASDLFFISGEIIKEEDQPVNINLGLQYKLLDRVIARAGLSAATSSASLGIGFIWEKLRIDIVSTHHPQLGITPGLMIIWTGFSKKARL
jgi:hypothetical protein